MATLAHTSTLVVCTCWCGIGHAVPRNLLEFQEQQHRDGVRQTGIYCPLGHSYIIAGKGEAELEREKRERAERRNANLDEELRLTVAELNQVKKAAATALKRTKGGACPCCNRTFVQLSRHIASKHPTFKPGDV